MNSTDFPLSRVSRGRGRPRADEASLSREEILRHSFTFFSEHGYDQVTMRDLAQACGVSNTLLHRHFGTKQELWTAAVDRVCGPINQAAIAVLENAAHLPAHELLRRVMEHSMALTSSDRQTLLFIQRESGGNNERAEYLRTRFAEPYFRRFNEIAAQGMPEHADPLHLAAIHLLHSGVTRVLLAPNMLQSELVDYLHDPQSRRRLIDTIIEMLFHGFLPVSADTSSAGNPQHAAPSSSSSS